MGRSRISFVYGTLLAEIGSKYYRKNEIWRKKIVRFKDTVLDTELITKNFAKVKYTLDSYIEGCITLSKSKRTSDFIN